MGSGTAMEPLGRRAGEIGDGDGLRGLQIWLVCIALMVALTAVIGAATRLTGSGLSITEWQPIMGIVPPLSEAQWQAAFAKYKQIPQYTELNRGMSLDAFKTIFYWEWGHRVVARSIGLLFLVPFLAFWALGRIPRSLVPRLAVLFALGGLQGGIGWFMVMSGLSERVSVSPYRLALHLGCAVLIFAVLVWTLLELGERRKVAGIYLTTIQRGQRVAAAALVGLIYMQILSGALVAGLKAGMTYNTWPLMDGRIVPQGLGQLSPWWLNIFENVTAVQFNHRMIAYVVVALALGQAVSVTRIADDPQVRRSAGWLAFAVVAQMALGIWTLLAWVPLSLGVAHQAGALAVLAVALWHLFAVRQGQ